MHALYGPFNISYHSKKVKFFTLRGGMNEQQGMGFIEYGHTF